MVAFDSRDEGTPEAVWREDPRLRQSAVLDVGVAELFVVAAHPDDETLGAGGLLQRLHAAGAGVTVIVATDGEASHPDSVDRTAAQLGRLRREEVARAVRMLAPGARLHLLGLPDGGLREARAELADGLDHLLGAATASAPERVLVVAPWSGDGHRDHRIVAEEVARACAGRGVRHLGYPIWLWHWGRPDDVPWDGVLVHPLTPEEIAVKRRATAEHATQVEPPSGARGDEPLLHARMREHFERDVEVFITEPGHSPRPSLAAEWFDAFYERHHDPWGFESRWYERRKRDILMASLPDRRLGAVLEIGCSTGIITRALARRADHVVATDAAAAAVAAARARTVGDDRVEIRHGAVPVDWPEGTYDTIVLSEVGYYLSRDDLRRTIARAEGSLAVGGSLIACHWRHVVAAYPQTGDDVHEALRRSGRWTAIVRHDEPDFVLEVFADRPASSVARREGLV